MTQQEELSIILDRLRVAKDKTKEWHNEINRWRNLYNLLHYRHRPKKNESQYPDPTPTNVVDTTVNILGSHPIEFRATGWKPSPQEEKDTSRVEKFLIGALDLASEREESLIPYNAHLNFARDGAAVIRTVWDRELADEVQAVIEVPNPEARPEDGVMQQARIFTELPLKTEVIDPLEVYLIPGGKKRWLHVFRETKMSIYDAETIYNFRDPDSIYMTESAKMEAKQNLVDYWSLRSTEIPLTDDLGQPVVDGFGGVMTRKGTVVVNAIIFNNKFIPGYELRVMSGYEDIPYTIQFFKPVNPKEPKNWGHSVIRPLEPSVSLIEKNVNRIQRQIDTFSSLPMMVKSLPGRDVQVDAGFGRSVNMSTEEDIGFPLWPGNPPDVYQQIEYLRSRLQQSGFSDVLFGLGGEGAGYALSQMADTNKIRLTEPMRHIELFWSTWARKILRLVRNFAGGSLIRIGGTMKGEGFAEQFWGREIADYRVTAHLKGDFPNQRVQNAAMATQAKGTLSEYTIMERFWDIEQPDDEWERKIMEIAQRSPVMIQYGVLSVLMKRAMAGDTAAQMAIEMMQQQPGRGRPPAEGGEPAPEQLTGTAGPTGQQPPQAAGGVPPGQSDLEQAQRAATAAPTMQGGIGG